MIAALVLAGLPSIVPWPNRVRIGSTTFAWPQHPRVTQRLLVPRDGPLGDEGYTLSVTAQGADAAANTRAGLFYAMQTLAQIAPRPGIQLKTMSIVDWPRYRWRGIHLDAARHFFDRATVERYIDVAAHYKLNVFHWHLTDDQAWRLPVSGYSRLTSRYRSYSEGDVKAVVAYARQRYVTVLPEIEMPAHASAALSAYPQFDCGGVFCSNLTTFAFLREALATVFGLFPAPVVGVGGDEVPAAYNEPAFFARIESYVRARNRRIAGWDEILSSQLSRSAIVLDWTSPQRAAQAARQGNDAVVSGWPLYFDAAQGDPSQEPPASRHMSTLAEVYASDVMPPGLDARAKAHILGGEAALWTERVRSPQHLFYMLLPRELALAEMLWTSRESKSWPSFLHRLPAQFDWLNVRSYAFRIPNALIDISAASTVFTPVRGHVQSVDAWTTSPRVTLRLDAPIDGQVRYTLNGSAPARSAAAYTQPIVLNLTSAVLDVRAATFFGGRAGAVTEARIHRVTDRALPRSGSARSWSALVSP